MYLELSSRFLELMSPWHEAESRIIIPAYQNVLQMFPIFRMQFASLNDLCVPAIICCKKIGSESKYFWVRQLRRLFPELQLLMLNFNASTQTLSVKCNCEPRVVPKFN